VFANDAVARIWRAEAFAALGEDRCRILKLSYPDGRPIPTPELPVVRALRGEVVAATECIDRLARRAG